MIREVKYDSESKYQLITESVPEYFFVYDLDKKEIIHLSNSFGKFKIDKGLSKLNQMRKLISKDYHKVFDKLFTDINEGHYSQNKDMEIDSFENKKRWVNISTYLIKESKSNKVAGHVIDISKFKNHSFKMIEKANELEHIMHMIAHDLRGPLGSIATILDVQKESIENMNKEEVTSYANFALRITMEMRETLNSLVEMVAMDAENPELNRYTTNFSDLVHFMVQSQELLFKQKEVKLQMEFEEEPVVIKVDPIKIKLAVQNLLSNALKFTPSEGVVTIRLKSGAKTISFEVEDSGIGIPKKHLSEIFERFGPFRRAGIRGEKSTGLGLSLTRDIIEAHGGAVAVDSKENEGTRFTITLPRH